MVAQMGIPCAVLTYPEPSGALTEWRAAFRRRWNVDTIEIGTDSFRLPANRRAPAPGTIRRHADRPASSQRQHAGSLPNGTAHFSRAFFCSPRMAASRSFPPRCPAWPTAPITPGFFLPSSSRNGVRARKLSGFTASGLPIRFFPSYAPIPNNGTSSCRSRLRLEYEPHSARPRLFVSRRV
jgi:hypothetical protein